MSLLDLCREGMISKDLYQRAHLHRMRNYDLYRKARELNPKRDWVPALTAVFADTFGNLTDSPK